MRGNRTALSGNRSRLLGHHTSDDGLDCRSRERSFANEHLVQHGPKRVNVGTAIDCALAHRLLGRHVCRSAERQSRLRHPRPARSTDGERDPEVSDERLLFVKQDVFRLDVPVNDSAAMR